MKIFVIILLVFNSISLPLTASDKSKADFLDALETEPLPNKINNLHDLQVYALYYSYHALHGHKESINSTYQFFLDKLESNTSYNRLEEIFRLSNNISFLATLDSNILATFDSNANILSQIEDLRNILSQANAPKAMKYSYIASEDLNLIDTQKFDHFLLKNNQDYFPNFYEALDKLGCQALSLKRKISTVINVINFSKTNIFNQQQKENLISVLNRYDDDNNFIIQMLLEFRGNTSLQLMDLYLFAENYIDKIYFISIQFKGQIKEFLKQFALSDAYEIYRSEEYPFRDCYLLEREIVLRFFDFVNKFRASAKLKPISMQEVESTDYTKKLFSLGDSHFDNTQGIALKEPDDNWDIDCIINNEKINKNNKKFQKRLEQSKKDKIKYNKLKNQNSIKASKDKTKRKVIEEKIANPSIEVGAKVYDLLKQDEKKILRDLFNNSLLDLDIEKYIILYNTVYKNLLFIKELEYAKKFLKYIVTIPSIFSEGKKTDWLLPFIALKIFPEGSNKESFIDNSKNYRKKQIIKDQTFLNIKNILFKAEENINKFTKNKTDKRQALFDLAHIRHKLVLLIDNKKFQIKNYKSELEENKTKIKEILREINISKHPTKLEEYLFINYLDMDFISNKKLISNEEIKNMQYKAYYNLANNNLSKRRNINVVNERGEFQYSYDISDSIFHAITNGELGDYIIIKFSRRLKENEIPLYVSLNDVVYRTDVFGGSHLKPNEKEGNYGSLIGITEKAAIYFAKYWLKNEEAYFYCKRAFTPEHAYKKTKVLSGKLRVATVSQERPVKVGPFLAHDGTEFYILALDGMSVIISSVARGLNLSKPDRKWPEDLNNMAYQAFDSYNSKNNYDVVEELLSASKEKINKINIKNISAKKLANALMGTPENISAVGIPVDGDYIILPDTEEFRKFAEEGLVGGRNPFAAKWLKYIDKDKIKFSKDLNNFRLSQYTITGYYLGRHDSMGISIKGNMLVVDDEKWPEEYKGYDIIAPSKDVIIKQSWTSEDIKNMDKNSNKSYIIHGKLVVTKDYRREFLVALNYILVNLWAGDFDGDKFNFFSAEKYKKTAELVKNNEDKIIHNPKINKTFIKRTNIGNYKKIKDLRKTLLATWQGVSNRFYYLSEKEQLEFAQTMADSHQLKNWLGKNWIASFGYESIGAIDIVKKEIQLGVKFGEDSGKTNIATDAILERAFDYQDLLNKFNPNYLIPYGNGLKKKALYSNNLIELTEGAMELPHGTNIIHKTARTIHRYLKNPDGDNYISDDDNSDNL